MSIHAFSGTLALSFRKTKGYNVLKEVRNKQRKRVLLVVRAGSSTSEKGLSKILSIYLSGKSRSLILTTTDEA